MKIGVITFWSSQDNYGQILQCYALQFFLKSRGYEVILIRYEPNSKEKTKFYLLDKFIKLFSLRHIVSYVKYRKDLVAYERFLKSNPRYFDEFRLRNISMSEKIYRGFKDLWLEDWSSFDVLICGSDQIWSNSSVENLRSYYLNFGQINLKRIAYAASFGRDVLSKEYSTLLPKLLSQIDCIGLRELSGVKLCKSAGRDDAQLVCDPTLLLSGQDYIQALVGEKILETNTLFCYLLKWETLFPYEQLKAFVQEQKLHINFIPAHGIEKENYFIPMPDLSIASWLQGIATAKYVVTNSFHGTVFSILLHRTFVSLPLVKGSSGMNDRLFTLLSYLGLENRILTERSSIKKILEEPIDWSNVDLKLQEFRNKSINFLEMALKKKIVKNKIETICFLTNGGVNHNYGGLDRVTEILTDYFTKQEIKVYYLSFTKRPEADGERQYYLPDSYNFSSKENISYYNRFLKEKKIDVLINQEGNVNIWLPCALENKLIYLTVLHFAPNYIPDYYFKNRISKLNLPVYLKKTLETLVCKTIINKCLLNYLRFKLKRNYQFHLRNCDRFILLSDRFKSEMLQFSQCIPWNLSAINNPLTFPHRMNKFEVKDKKNILLYVGRMEIGQKRLDLLLRMWKDMSLDYETWCLKLVGDGPDISLLKQMVSIEKIQNVSFEGWQDPIKYYKEASIFCFTSGPEEGWGMALVEAQSYGCVPVAFNSYASIYDIIHNGETGYVVEAFDERQYREKIINLISDIECRQYMAKQCMLSVNRFLVENIGEQWLHLFEIIKREKQ